MFKKLLSFLLITVLLTVPLAAAPAAKHTDPILSDEAASVGESELALVSTGTMGEIFSSAVNRKQSADINSVTDVTVEDGRAWVTLNNSVPCRVVVGIYDEAGDRLITSLMSSFLSPDAGSAELIYRGEVPEFFYLRAYILDLNACPIGEVYESARYTRAYSDFLAKTADDFSADRVLNFDGDPADNFAVFDESVRTVPTSDDANIPSKNGENVYIFTRIDDSLRGLEAGDIFTFTLDGNAEVVKVSSAQYSGDTLTVLADKAQLEEVFDYVKIDTESEQPQTAPTGCDMDSSGLAATGLDFDVQYAVNETYPLGPEVGDTFAGVTGSVSIGLTVSVKLHYFDDILETALILDAGGVINVTLLAKFTKSIPLGVVPIPTPIPSVTVNVKVELELEAEAKAEVSVPFKSRTGFSYSSLSGFTNLSTMPEFDFNGCCEGKAYTGVKVTPALSALLGMVQVGLGGKIGLQAVGTRMPTVSDFKASDHLCRWCIEGSLNIVFGADAQVTVVKTWTKDLGSITKKLFNFHYSSDTGFGHGSCENKREPEQEEITHPDLDKLPTAGSTTTTCSLSGPHDDMTMTVHVSGSGAVNGDQVWDDMSDYEHENVWIYNEQVEKEACEVFEVNYEWLKTAAAPIVPDGFSEYKSERWRTVWHYKIYVHGFTIVKDFPFTGIEAITGPCEYLMIDAHSIPDTVRVAGYPNTYGNWEIEASNFPSSMEYNYCIWKNVTSVTAPASLKYTVWDAFPNVETATLLTEAEHVFCNSKKLTKATIGDNVTKLSKEVFAGCTALRSVAIPSSVTHIESSAFADTGLERVTIPGSVKKIDNYAFLGCKNLREVVIEEGVKEIAYDAFANCPKLERIVLPRSVAIMNINLFDDDNQIIVDYNGTVEEWNNILISHSYYNDISQERYGDLIYANYDFGFVVFCCPDESGSPASTGSSLAPTGASPNLLTGLYPGTDYLITVEDTENGLLYGAVSALKQIKADKNGCIDVSEFDVPDGMFLNAYGACLHLTAHAETVDGRIQCVCDACGEHVSPVIVGEPSRFIPDEERLLGDADCSREVTILDATAIQRALAGLIVARWHAGAADTDRDEASTILDATAIQRWLAGLSCPDGIGEPL